MYICPFCSGRHEKVAQAYVCKARAESQQQPASHTVATRMATEKQLDYIGRVLKGDLPYARTLTVRQASEYIDRLKKDAKKVTPQPANRTVTKIPLDMIKNIRPGYYAMRQSDTEAWRFYRVSQPKTGRFRNAMKFQTQHSEKYNLVMTFYPDSGNLYWYNLSTEDDILMLAVNQRACAIDYGQHIGRCCRCNKELTDARSRWFGIGPECEKYWPEVIDLVTDSKGDFVGV